jgi:electron transport complex protein RnfG
MFKAMVGIGVLCAFLIVSTFELTLPRIEKNKKEALAKAIFDVLPGAELTTSFGMNSDLKLEVLDEENPTDNVFYAGFNQNEELIGIAIEAQGQGYADILRILYGYDPDKQIIIGFKVLESKETPGLGDKIEKDPNFLQNFEALDAKLSANLNEIENKIVTVKYGTKSNPWEIDGITGATISSRAIGDIIGASSEKRIPLLYKQLDKINFVKLKQKGQSEK